MAKTLTGLSPRREQQYQDRMIGRIAQRMDASFQREISRAMNEQAKYAGNTGRQAEAMQKHRDNLAKLLVRQYSATFDMFGPRILENAPKHHMMALETKDAQSVFDVARERWILTQAGAKVTEIAGTTGKQAQAIIQAATQAAVAEGMASQAQLGKLIQSAMREKGGMLSRSRSRVIARTEAHASANAANEEAAKATGLDLRKEWVASHGGDTRDDHADADGQTVGLNEHFTVGGEQLMYPGDPSGSPENVINCRCTSVHIAD